MLDEVEDVAMTGISTAASSKTMMADMAATREESGATLAATVADVALVLGLGHAERAEFLGRRAEDTVLNRSW